MLNFSFQNPTNAVFGKGQLEQLDSLVPKDARVLVTYGGGSAKRTGVLDRVTDELAKSGRAVFEFGGIEANPQFATLMQAVEMVRSEAVDFLLAVGGGSVMDGTKFIAIAAANDEFKGSEEAILSFGFAGVPASSAVPLGCVVTLPATGSEMNPTAVISSGEDKLPVICPLTYPVFSILDPELTFTLPENQVANGVVDTFVHVMEQYMTYPVEARVQDRFAEGIIHTLIEIGRKTIDEPRDYDARANLVWAATMALNGLIGSGVPQDWATHMIGHELTALHGVDHGRSLAAIMPGMWRVRREQKRAKLLQYAERIWGLVDGSENERIDTAITRTEEFFHGLGVTTRLSDLGITEEHFDAVIASLEKHGMVALSEHGDLDPGVARQVLEASR